MEKCKQMRKRRYPFTILSFSWRCKYSMTGLPSWHLANSAKSTVIQMSGWWSKATSDQEWKFNSVQDGKFRARCCPKIVVKLSVQAHGDLCEGSRTNLQGRSWTTTIRKSLTINTWRKSSQTFDRSWIVLRMLRYLIRKPSYWSGDYLCQHRCKHQCILGKITTTITLFDITQKLILDQDFEMLNVSTIEWTFSPWMRSTLLHDKDIEWAKAKVHVHSDSVLCLWKLQEHAEANEKWKDQLLDFPQSNEYRELFGIDGEPIEFEWNVFPGLTTLHTLQKIQDKLEAHQTSPEELEERIIFMSMFNDIDWTKREKIE